LLRMAGSCLRTQEVLGGGSWATKSEGRQMNIPGSNPNKNPRPNKPHDILERNVVYIQFYVGAGLIVFGALLLILYHWAGIFSPSDTSGASQTLGYISTGIIGAGVAVLPSTAAGAASARLMQGFPGLTRAPTATTKDATPLPAVGGAVPGYTLEGTVNPASQQTSYYFEYGPTVAYGTNTPIKTLPAGTTDQQVSEPVNPLAAGSHYRLVAHNPFGTGTGADKTT